MAGSRRSLLVPPVASHQDTVGDRVRNTNPSRADLEDPGITRLAHPKAALLGEAESTQHLPILNLQMGAVEPAVVPGM